MIAILDPALFITRAPEGPLDPEEQEELLHVFEGVIGVMKETRATLPGDDWYWGPLTREFLGPLSRRLVERGVRPSRLQQALQTLLSYKLVRGFPDRPTKGVTKLWGVKALYAKWDWCPSWRGCVSPDWLSVMERVLIGAVQQGDVVLLTRFLVGRNVHEHADRKCVLREKDPWRCYAHVPGHPPRGVPCLANVRNRRVPWTTRFDERLPDSGKFPFCPPPQWWRRKGRDRGVDAWRTLRSKPCWMDRFGNGWAQPVTGGIYHWDVFIEDVNQQEEAGLDALNVVAWGTTEAGKIPGQIHHVPEDKAGRLKPSAGWTCPKLPPRIPPKDQRYDESFPSSLSLTRSLWPPIRVPSRNTIGKVGKPAQILIARRFFHSDR